MKGKLLLYILMVFVVSPGMFLSTAKASTAPKLPSVAVTMTVVNGTASYYVASLSNVPLGYDVANGVYTDWCVDRRYTTVRGSNIQVVLYSSVAPPANLSSQRWDKVNYILNHKQGGMMDIQNAIWYFVKMGGVGWWNGSSPSATSLATVSDALAHGNGYVPGPGGLLAVICLPLTQTQITVIEFQLKIPVPVGGYSYSIAKTNSTGNFMPYLASMTVLPVLLVVFKRKTGTKARAHKRGTTVS
jgi:hypothetical protein